MSDDQIQNLREALQHSPDNPPLMRMLADALMNAGHHGEALDTWKALQALRPGDTDARLGMARCYYTLGKDDTALVICEEIVSHQSDHAAANLLLARCHYRLGNLDAAGRAYRVAKTRDGSLNDPALEVLLDDDVDEDYDGPFDLARPSITFADVGGMDEIKDEIRMKIIHPLANPELFKAYGKAIGGGLLLYGPPGCGKTHLARATAGEVDASFISIGITDILDMYIGSSEQNLARLFEQARANRPCVVFIDEVDALAADRRDLRQSAGRNVINHFLAEMDGISANNDGLLIIAATNAPWHLDSAFRRPGRFDRILFVPPPDVAARSAVLHVLLANKPTDKVDVEAIARKTDQFSGADLKGAIDIAIEAKLRQAMASGKPEPLVTRDLLAAVKKVQPTTREWLSSAKNHALYANQDGTYDEVLRYLKIGKR